MRYKTPNREERGGIVPTVDKYAEENGGIGYLHFRFYRVRGVNTSNLMKIFNKAWQTIRDWEDLDDKEFGVPQAEELPELVAAMLDMLKPVEPAKTEAA
jgi:hypothetical protein